MFDRKKDTDNVQELIDDVQGIDYEQLEEDAGPLGRAFINSVDKAVQLQSGAIRGYVNWLRRQNPDASPADIQDKMDKHFRNAVSGTGAGVGAAAAVPGIGLVTGAAAVAGESVLFLDLAAFYTVASSYLRGVDINDPERRRTAVLTVLMGSQGLAIVDAIMGADVKDLASKNTLARFAGPQLAQANSILKRVAMRSFTKRMRNAWIGKMLPLGLGAVAGTVANRKLAAGVIDNVSEALGAAPAEFPEPLPEKASQEEATLSANPKNFVQWVLGLFGDKVKGKEAKEKDEKKNDDENIIDAEQLELTK